jgi:DNA-binding PadR family transcriptional regulator
MKGQALKGHLDMLLLAVVREGATHGYAIIEALRRHSDGALDIPEGTIYPALHRLERLGALSSRWDDSLGRRRRVYALTASGRRLLEQRAHDWSLFSKVITSVIGARS